MLFQIVGKFLKTVFLTAILGLGLGEVQNISAQTARQIKFTPCHRILPLTGNLTKKKNNFLYAIALTKGQILKINLSSKPAYKQIYVNVYQGTNRSDSKLAILQGEIGNDYDLQIEETGKYSIMVYANKKVTRFSLALDVEDKRWKC
jgi:hypothetical protein